jgi:uncharacterized sodium:solute symporter family permease YidK
VNKFELFNAWFLNILNQFLSSMTGLYIAIIAPIIVIFMPDSVKSVENILSSNWIQLWALFVLGIMAVRQADMHTSHAEKLDAIHDHLGITKGDK